MPRSTGLTTTERGLGYSHQAKRKRDIRELVPGTPCWRCGQPMWPHQKLDLDHITDRYYGGAGGPTALAHRYCNRSAGQRLATRIRVAKRAMATVRGSAPSPSRHW